jgi:hypothetical protein
MKHRHATTLRHVTTHRPSTALRRATALRPARVPRPARRDDREQGSISAFLAVSAVGLLLVIGLVADGGAKVRATQEADAVAAEAARAAGQAVDVSTSVTDHKTRVDPHAAVAAAERYLTAADHTGTATITDDGRMVEVTVTITRPTAVLSLIGITHTTVTGHARATLVHAATGEQP